MNTKRTILMLLAASGVILAQGRGGPSANLVGVGGAGASKPATCSFGQTYVASDGTATAALYICTATNTWSEQIGGSPQGVVLYNHDPSGTFSVSGPLGAVVSCSGTTTSCLQESWDYARTNGYCWVGWGGELGMPGVVIHNRITTKTPLTLKTKDGGCIYANGLDLVYDVNGGADASKALITTDSSDRLEFHWIGGQIVYPGNSDAFQLTQTNDNGETYIGNTISHIQITTIAIVNPVTLAPETGHGTGFRIKAVNGSVLNNYIEVGEINGGDHGFVAETPAVGKSINLNEFNLPGVHGQGVDSLSCGTDGSAGGRIYGNKWFAIITPVGVGLSDWCGAGMPFGGEKFDLSILNGTTGVILQSSSQSNQYNVSYNSATTKYTDNSTTKDWHGVIYPGAGYRVPAVAGAIPTVDGLLSANTTNHTLAWGSNGTTMVGAIAATGTGTATTCTNQAITALSSLAVPTCSSIVDAMVSGQLSVAHGGTGLGTLTAHALYVGNATSAPTALSVGATDKPLVGLTSGDPAFSKLTLTNPATTATFTLADNKTFTVNNTLTITATDGITMTTPTTSFTAARTDAAQTFTGAQTIGSNAIGSTSTDGYILQNTTAAAAGAQQFSPRVRLTGAGWKTDATAASQTVDWAIDNEPVQGAANPDDELYFKSQIAGGGYVQKMVVGAYPASTTLGALWLIPNTSIAAGNYTLFAGPSNTILNAPTGGTLGFRINHVDTFVATATAISVTSGIPFVWNSDSGFSREAAALIDVGDGVQGHVNGTLKGQGIINSGGTPVTISGCTTVSAITGGATAGSFSTTTTGTCTAAITMNGATGLTAPHGWVCHASDITAGHLVDFTQTATSTTGCTVQGATTSGDTVVFMAIGY